jgi:hypothetical protein
MTSSDMNLVPCFMKDYYLVQSLFKRYIHIHIHENKLAAVTFLACSAAGGGGFESRPGRRLC